MHVWKPAPRVEANALPQIGIGATLMAQPQVGGVPPPSTNYSGEGGGPLLILLDAWWIHSINVQGLSSIACIQIATIHIGIATNSIIGLIAFLHRNWTWSLSMDSLGCTHDAEQIFELLWQDLSQENATKFATNPGAAKKCEGARAISPCKTQWMVPELHLPAKRWKVPELSLLHRRKNSTISLLHRRKNSTIKRHQRLPDPLTASESPHSWTGVAAGAVKPWYLKQSKNKNHAGWPCHKVGKLETYIQMTCI